MTTAGRVPRVIDVLESAGNRFVRMKAACTLSPPLATVENVTKLMDDGMSAVRIVMAEHSQQEMSEMLRVMREAKAARPQLQCAVLMETRGAELYTGPLPNGQSLRLAAGQEIHLVNSQDTGDSTTLTCDYELLPRLLGQDDLVYFDEGAVVCQVSEVLSNGAHLTVIEGGEVGQRKRITVPNASMNIQAVTPADLDDVVNVAVKHGADFLILSQIRSAQSLERVKETLAAKGNTLKLLVKLQNKEILESLEAVLNLADGVVISFFELSLVLPKAGAHLVLEAIIAHCNARGKPAIFQHEAVISASAPFKRMETNVLSTAIVMGADAILYPRCMPVDRQSEVLLSFRKLCSAVESSAHFRHHLTHSRLHALHANTAVDIACLSALSEAKEARLALVVGIVGEGCSLDTLAKYRPDVPLLVLAPNETPLACLLSNCVPQKYARESEARCVEEGLETAKGRGLVSAGARVAVVSGLGFQSSVGSVKITAVS